MPQWFQIWNECAPQKLFVFDNVTCVTLHCSFFFVFKIVILFLTHIRFIPIVLYLDEACLASAELLMKELLGYLALHFMLVLKFSQSCSDCIGCLKSSDQIYTKTYDFHLEYLGTCQERYCWNLQCKSTHKIDWWPSSLVLLKLKQHIRCIGKMDLM